MDKKGDKRYKGGVKEGRRVRRKGRGIKDERKRGQLD